MRFTHRILLTSVHLSRDELYSRALEHVGVETFLVTNVNEAIAKMQADPDRWDALLWRLELPISTSLCLGDPPHVVQNNHGAFYMENVPNRGIVLWQWAVEHLSPTTYIAAVVDVPGSKQALNKALHDHRTRLRAMKRDIDPAKSMHYIERHQCPLPAQFAQQVLAALSTRPVTSPR